MQANSAIDFSAKLEDLRRKHPQAWLRLLTRPFCVGEGAVGRVELEAGGAGGLVSQRRHLQGWPWSCDV